MSFSQVTQTNSGNHVTLLTNDRLVSGDYVTLLTNDRLVSGDYVTLLTNDIDLSVGIT